MGNEPFLVVSGDIACDFPFAKLQQPLEKLAHLVFVDNPAHHPTGDFALNADGLVSMDGENKFTFSGIGVYNPTLFANLLPGKLKLSRY